MNELRFIKRKEVETITGLSRSSIYAKMESGSFPSAIKLGERSVAWIYDEVLEWAKNRVLATRSGVVQC